MSERQHRQPQGNLLVLQNARRVKQARIEKLSERFKLERLFENTYVTKALDAVESRLNEIKRAALKGSSSKETKDSWTLGYVAGLEEAMTVRESFGREAKKTVEQLQAEIAQIDRDLRIYQQS